LQPVTPTAASNIKKPAADLQIIIRVFLGESEIRLVQDHRMGVEYADSIREAP